MNIVFAPKGILQIDDVRIIHKNFSGIQTAYNREGDRNFSIVIPSEDIAQALQDEGWNLKVKPPKNEDDPPFIFLPVKIKFTEKGPNIYLRSGKATQKLTEESIGILDHIDILQVNLDIRPFNWNMNGKSGKSAYLYNMEVIQNIDRFAARMAEEEYPEE